jgi:hypothetical protein
MLAIFSSLLAVLAALVAEQGVLSQDSVAAGWLMPVAAVLVVAGVSWLLLGETPRRDMRSSSPTSSDVCPVCSREVGEGWRLCPWCGYRKDERTDRVAPEAAESVGR